jgi:hypothetical protein
MIMFVPKRLIPYVLAAGVAGIAALHPAAAAPPADKVLLGLYNTVIGRAMCMSIIISSRRRRPS